MNKKSDSFLESIKTGLSDFKLGTQNMFKEFFKKETNKKQRANMWSFSRLIIPVVTGITSTIAIITSSYPIFAITGAIAALGAITDALDGASARKHKSKSEYGKILDQVTDKYFAGIVGINLLFLNPIYIYLLIGELLIASINAGYKIKYPKLNIESSKIGKVKTWPLYLSLALGYLSPINSTLLTISNLSIAITSVAQFLTCFSYLNNNSKEVIKLKRKEKIEQINQSFTEYESKEKELVFTKEKEQTLLDRYKELNNLLKEIIKLKEPKKTIDINNPTKIKKL